MLACELYKLSTALDSEEDRQLKDERMVMLWLHMYCAHLLSICQNIFYPNERVSNQKPFSKEEVDQLVVGKRTHRSIRHLI